MLLIASVFFLSSCDKLLSGNSSSCGDAKTVSKFATLGPSQLFTLETPDAKNDCEAYYLFKFQWADYQRSNVDTAMPPLVGLEHGFAPKGEFGYFPHSAPIRTHELNQLNGNFFYLWKIAFYIGNKNGGNPTKYYLGVELSPSAKQIDSTFIVADIQYYPYTK